MDELWPKLRDLFETDDGSFPDVLVDGISGEQVSAIYSWVRSQAGVFDEPTLWIKAQEADVPIKEIEDPAGLVVSGEVAQFRHGLTNLAVSDVVLPPLTIVVFPNQIGFDYRMGADWGARQLSAFFEFLAGVLRFAPDAIVTHRFEGADKATPVFTEVLHDYIQRK